jgi:hypothetical protein
MADGTPRDWSEPLAAEVRTIRLPQGNGALVVRPAGGTTATAPAPGILWLHWLGHNRGDCTEFVPEAIELAGQGAISVLPQGTFPWSDHPSGRLTDAAKVSAEVQRVREALQVLRALPDVDAGRLAIVGHDYGAMYGLALKDPDVRLFIAATPDSSWSRWFLKYWPVADVIDGDYSALLEAFDPLQAAASYGSRLRMQWAESDEYVPEYVRDLFAISAPLATSTTYAYDHQLGQKATADRITMLRESLGLTPAESAAVPAWGRRS